MARVTLKRIRGGRAGDPSATGIKSVFSTVGPGAGPESEEILRLKAALLEDLERVVVTFFAAANDDEAPQQAEAAAS
ncbi:MAG: hypothetical protein U1E56_07155 [Bauldia sp.]